MIMTHIEQQMSYWSWMDTVQWESQYINEMLM